MMHVRAARVVMAMAMAASLIVAGAALPASGEEPSAPGGDEILPTPGPEVTDADRAEDFDEVEAAAGDGTVRALVVLDAPVEPGVAAGDPDGQIGDAIEEAADTVEAALASSDSTVVHRFTTLPYVSVEISADGVEALREVGEVVSISELDMVARPLLESSLPAIQAPEAWNLGAEGTDQLVAVIDTGIDTSNASPHPDLAARVDYEACFSHGQCPGATSSADGPGSAAPCDDHITCGHGTGVTAIAAAVAPQADVLSIRAATRTYCSGWACFVIPNAAMFFWDDVLAAMDHVATFAAENPSAPRISAVNMSLGGLISAEELEDPDACDSHPEEPLLAAVKQAVDALTAQGIAVVVASGNNGMSDQVMFPACTTGTIAVGATDVANEEVAAYSDSSPKIDLLAPGGEGSGCASPDGLVVPWDDGTLTTCSGAGTSFAAPHVAGAWAVLREKVDAAGVPASATVPVIRELLASTGTPITDPRNSLVRPAILLGPAVEAVDSLPDAGELEGIGGYQPIASTTVVDTTVGLGTCDGDPCERLSNEEVRAQVSGVGSIPASGVNAVMLRVTAVDPSGGGGVLVNVDAPVGTADGVIYTHSGADDSVTGIAHLDGDGTIGLAALYAASDVTVDVVGYFGDEPNIADLGYQPDGPTLLADSSEGSGDCLPSPCARLAALDALTVPVDLGSGIEAAMLNVSLSGASAPGTATVSDSGGVVATFQVDDGNDVADLVPVDGDITIESTVDVDIAVTRIGGFGEGGGRLASSPTSIAMTPYGDGLCDPGPCGLVEEGNQVRMALPGIADLPDGCVSAAVLLVAAQAQDAGVLEIGSDGTAAQATIHLTDADARGQIVLATPDEEGYVSFDATVDMEVTVLMQGWLACPDAQWLGLFD